MTIYTVYLHTPAYWTSCEIEAETPEHALFRAHGLDDEVLRELDFHSYDNVCIEHIEVLDAPDHIAVKWRDPEALIRLAARDLLEALEQAVEALNAAPRFKVPGLATDSYAIAAICDRAIRKAKPPPG